MALDLKASRSNVTVGLNTFNHTAASTGMYTVQVQCLENPPSSISILIKQNGSTKATSSAPRAAQAPIDIQTVLNCTQGDVISVVISSSADIDNQLNTVKANIIVRPGL